MVNGNDIHGRPRPQQLVVAIAVGGRLEGELQCLGYLQHRSARGLCRPVQEINDMGTADDLLLERDGTGLTHGLQAIESDHREDVDELAIPVGVVLQFCAHLGQGGRQIPILERRAVTKRAGLLHQHRQIMPGIVDDLVA